MDLRPLIQITLPRLQNYSISQIITGRPGQPGLILYVWGIAGFLILFFIAWGGFQILTSRGDPKAIASGQEKITYAVVGFLVMFAAYWILRLVGRILNLSPLD